MDHIDQHLATAARNKAYKPCIQAAVVMGKKLLNKYYSYTDHSELYHIAMGELTSLNARSLALLTNNFCSSSSKPQAGLLRSGRLGQRVACNC